MDKRTEKAIALATKWYPKGKLAHSMRVANYAIQEAKLLGYDTEETEEIFQVAILHDILEDTECPRNTVLETLYYQSLTDALERLTHKEEDSYEEYIIKLCDDSNVHDATQVKSLAYARIIKRADMKDHLTIEETLNENLKQKYFPIIKYLL